ncbi:MAG TPA: hypothetical protein VEV17_05310, partial [Bryobacteraceae bacterium]|nr:hypothetical protein [Bryobacteraceae bacterium]
MRNKHPGTCYKCSTCGDPDDGYIERHKGGWRVQYVRCKDKEPGFVSFGEAVQGEVVGNKVLPSSNDRVATFPKHLKSTIQKRR